MTTTDEVNQGGDFEHWVQAIYRAQTISRPAAQFRSSCNPSYLVIQQLSDCLQRKIGCNFETGNRYRYTGVLREVANLDARFGSRALGTKFLCGLESSPDATTQRPTQRQAHALPKERGVRRLTRAHRRN